MIRTSWLGMGLAALLLTGCGGDDEGGKPGSPQGGRTHETSGKSWTFMVYMVSDNDLEPFALEDLAEMIEVGTNDTFQILVQSDRAAGYTDDGVGNLPDWTTAKRLRVAGGKLEVVDDLGELNMGDPATLGEFIGWAGKTAPADRYALVFWDHGGAWPGFGPDESQKDHDLLTSVELKKGVDDGMKAAGIDQFALIGFDACLMSTFETAMVLRPFGEYLLASEELEPGHGWDYRSLQRFADDATLGPIELGKELMAGFDAQAKEKKTHPSITLALTDLYGPLDAVDEAVAALAKALGGGGAVAEAPLIGKERAGVTKYGDSPNPAQATHMIDLGHFAKQLEQASPGLEAPARAVLDAIDGAVVASTHGASKAKSTGLSIYFPPQKAYYTPSYSTIEEVATWRAFLESYFEAAGNTALTPEFTNADHVADVVANDDGTITASGQLAEGSASLVAQASLAFGIVVPDAGVVMIGDQPAAVDESGLVASSWDTSILLVTQGEHEDYGYLSIAIEEEFLAATIPFAYREAPGSDEVLVLLKLLFDAKGNEVAKTFYRITEGGPGELTPAPGSEVQPLVLLVPAGGGASEWGVAGEVVFDPTEPLVFDLALLSDGIAVEMKLTAIDFGGNGDFVSFQGVL